MDSTKIIASFFLGIVTGWCISHSSSETENGWSEQREVHPIN
jgi:hypothetical protein